MDENFTKFNIRILNQIHDFINSQDDLLYIAGFQGCGKSELVNFALKDIGKDILLFRHLCFKNSVIDDFLLGFYDNLRYYSINKKINLKKSLTENFAQKVSFYFKNLDEKCLIIIDNFDLISKNSEIVDFLSHLGKFENVKLILISRALNPEFFENKNLNLKTIEIEPNDYFTFKLKIEDALEIFDEADIEELYKQTKGYELYLKMTLRYISTVNVTLKEFVDEFKKRKMEFSDFLLSKIVSLVPSIYLPFLQNISCLNHSVKIGFIEHYKLGDISLVNYLHRKLLISRFDDEIYLKDYLKEYFLSGLSVKEKINNYKNLIEIYEQELAKSPKDRILRLSRESIRKQIEFLKTKLPKVSGLGINEQNQNFSYIQQTRTAGMPWYTKLTKLKEKTPDEGNKNNSEKNKHNVHFGKETLSEEEKKLIKEFRKNKEKTNSKGNLADIKENGADILNHAQKLEENYDYAGAISLLSGIKNKVQDKSLLSKILLKLAQNYTKINDFEASLKNYDKAYELLKGLGNTEKCANIKLETANLYKNVYRFKMAKECLNSITENTLLAKNTTAKAYLMLGEIFEMENNFKTAHKNYEKALQASDLEYPDNKLLSEIYFKTAILYDDGQNTEKALEYYQKSIDAIKNSDVESSFYSTCYVNMGLIYSELWAENTTGTTNNYAEEYFKKTAQNFEIALEIDKKEENQNGIYFVSRQLSMLYRDIEPQKSAEFLQNTLDAAVTLKDNFKTAISRLELGDYYYNAMNNRLALINYFEAQKALGAEISDENKERISTRINDMKIKMESSEFSEIAEEYGLKYE